MTSPYSGALGVDSIADVVRGRARVTPEKTAIVFRDRACAYGEIWEGAGRVARRLRARGIEPGDRVVLALPNGIEFFFAFFGVLRAGGIAVPVYPGSDTWRHVSVARLCGAKGMILRPSLPGNRVAMLRDVRSTPDGTVAVLPPDPGPEDGRGHPEPDPGDAYIQYTSGSTGDPKGVVLTHANLMSNVVQMIEAMEITDRDVFVSWLPTYHDMGLTLMALTPFTVGTPVVLLPTSLRDIPNWLETIRVHRGTFIAAPDFAYRWCVRTIGRPTDFDLSSLRVAMNASEPVRAGTIRDFETAFGLGHVAMTGYGLAEATLSVTCSAPGGSIGVDERGFVGLGRPLPGTDVEIVRGRAVLPAGEVGEIVVRGPGNSRGYWGNLGATKRLRWSPGYIRTGDLGYLDRGGQLFFVGREKNIIKVAGRTIYPQEVEEIVDAVPEVRSSAAVGVDTGRIEGEQLCAFAEVRLDAAGLRSCLLEIVRAIHSNLGIRPSRTYLLRPKSIPRTPNGKVQHDRLRRQYADGSLFRDGALLFPT